MSEEQIAEERRRQECLDYRGVLIGVLQQHGEAKAAEIISAIDPAISGRVTADDIEWAKSAGPVSLYVADNEWHCSVCRNWDPKSRPACSGCGGLSRDYWLRRAGFEAFRKKAVATCEKAALEELKLAREAPSKNEPDRPYFRGELIAVRLRDRLAALTPEDKDG